MLDFQNMEILEAERSRRPKCVIMPNFTAIGQTVSEIWRFFNFQNGGRRHVGFLKLQIFNGRDTQEG